MLRTKLLTAAAATVLMAGPAFAQEATQTPAPTAAPPASAATPAAANTVIDVLQAEGNFTTLLAALDQAQLTETLRARPAISIFAPTDEAFAALPEAERTRLMDPANAQALRSLLLYHVIIADVTADQITGARGGVETAAESQVLLDGTGDAIKVDDATVTRADIDASNGAVYVIDKVLSPAGSQAAMGDEEAVAPATPSTPDETPAPAEPAPTLPEAGATPSTEAPSAATANPAPVPTTTPN